MSGRTTFLDRVLLIHPDEEVRDELGDAVMLSGWDVLQAEDIEDALDALVKRPLAVICDGRGGPATLRAIHGRLADLPIIFVAGEGDGGALAAWRDGAFDYIAEPDNHDALIAAVDRAGEHYGHVIRKRRVEREAEEARARNAERLKAEIERVRAENTAWVGQLHERNQRLNEEMAERDRLEVALKKAHDEALAASQAKSTFLANMSHELRTPLNAILGYTEMLLEDLDDLPPVVADLQRVHGAGTHLLGVINEVLDLSRIEAGRVDLRPEPTALAEVAEEVAAVCRPLAERSGLVFVTELSSGQASVDPQRTRQILLNVIGNAVKFTDEGRVTLTLERRGDEMVFAVTDTGPGMSPADVARVFKPFERATTSKEGTGLGLAISQRLCDLMGGWIRARSELNVGTTFELGFPAL